MEGIKLWNDEIAGYSRHFCLYMGLSFKRGTFHRKDRKRIFGLIVAFAMTLKHFLRDEDARIDELTSLLSQTDLQTLKQSANKPSTCLNLLTEYVVEAMKGKGPRYPGPYYVMLMGHLQSLASCQARCSRIKHFKVAYGYTSYLNIFLAVSCQSKFPLPPYNSLFSG